jgi:hypothetical protein
MKQLNKYLLKNIFEDKVDFNFWHTISREYELSEDFIRIYQDKLNWYYISEYQDLSEKFIIEFKDKVNVNLVLKNQKLSIKFLNKTLKSYIGCAKKLGRNENNADVIEFYAMLIRNKHIKNSNKKYQKSILMMFIPAIKLNKNYYYEHMTEYMKDLYDKMSIFL